MAFSKSFTEFYLNPSQGFSKLWKLFVGEPCHTVQNQVESNGVFLPFGVYAACKLLDVDSNDWKTRRGSQIFEAVRTMSCFYMRADQDGFTDCIAAFGLHTLLTKKISEYKVFTAPVSSVGVRRKSSTDLVVSFLSLLEALMLEYLGSNWDNIDQILAVNAPDLKEDGLVCKWDQKPTAGTSGRNVHESSDAKLDPSVVRARNNWRRAYRVSIRQVALQSLGLQRKFRTLSQMCLELNRDQNGQRPCTPEGSSSRVPILLLLGGGMAAGKSTVREIIGTDNFWSKVCKDAVIVEADAIKNHDVIFKVLSDRLGSDPSISTLVHEYSTSAAEDMLVTAINNEKDVVFDGTMSWLPFVEQTIQMARDHKHHYVRGPGYFKDDQGQWREEYWKCTSEYSREELQTRNPYRIEIVGVTCDPGLAVARGLWRKLRTGRGVPISAQLRSHRLFSENFEKIAKLVDSATLYHTGTNLTTFSHTDTNDPKVIAHSSSVTRGEMLVNPPKWTDFQRIKDISDAATGWENLFPSPTKKCPSRALPKFGVK